MTQGEFHAIIKAAKQLGYGNWEVSGHHFDVQAAPKMDAVLQVLYTEGSIHVGLAIDSQDKVTNIHVTRDYQAQLERKPFDRPWSHRSPGIVHYLMSIVEADPEDSAPVVAALVAEHVRSWKEWLQEDDEPFL